MDQFLAILETNTFLISIYFLLIIQGNRVGIVVLYKESVIFPCLFFFSRFPIKFWNYSKNTWCKIYKVWKYSIANVITHFDKWTLSPNFPAFDPSPEKPTIVFELVKEEGGDVEPLAAELGDGLLNTFSRPWLGLETQN